METGGPIKHVPGAGAGQILGATVIHLHVQVDTWRNLTSSSLMLELSDPTLAWSSVQGSVELTSCSVSDLASKVTEEVGEMKPIVCRYQ